VHYVKTCAEDNYDSWFRVLFVTERHLRKNVTEHSPLTTEPEGHDPF